MADHPLPNPALEATCEALKPLGWQWDPAEQTCISPAPLPGATPPTTIPGVPGTLPPIPGTAPTTKLPTGHVIVTQDELAKLERQRDTLRTQRNMAIGGTFVGLVLGALGGWALAR